MDGEWEAPSIPNPDYKGEWSPKMIDNPEYKGVWKHPQVANPEYEADDSLYQYDSIGLDLWQVKSGTIFDNILITDDVATAEAAAADFKERVKGEKAMKKAEEEKKKAEEEAAKEEAEDDDGDDTEAKDEL